MTTLFGGLPDDFSSIDWSRGTQTIDGITYQPVFHEQGSGENLEIGPLQLIHRYKAGETSPGNIYEQIDPGTGKILATQVRPKSGGGGFFGDLWEAASSVAADIGPVAQYVPVVGQIVTAINAINAARQGNVLPAIGTLANMGGYTEVAKGIKALDAIKNEDYLGAVMPALQATGIASLGGVDTKDIAKAVNVLQAVDKKDSLAPDGAASGYLPGLELGGPGADSGALMALMAGLNQQKSEPDSYKVAQNKTPSPFGSIFDEPQMDTNDLMQILERG